MSNVVRMPPSDGSPATRLVRIGEDAGRTALLVDGVVQSISPEDGLVDGGYWAAMLPPGRPRRVLILGLGGGTLARLLASRWGAGVHILGVDDDAAIVETARAAGWLAVPDLEVVYADAFDFVRRCQRRFDFVAVDLFRGERVDGRIFARPFLRRLRDLLAPRALLAINMFQDRRVAARCARLESMFCIEEQRLVGGNVVVHARARRGR